MDDTLAEFIRKIDTDATFRFHLESNFSGKTSALDPRAREAVRAHFTLYGLTIGESIQPGVIRLEDSATHSEVYVDRHNQISGDPVLTAKLRRLKHHLKNEGLAMYALLTLEMDRRGGPGKFENPLLADVITGTHRAFETVEPEEQRLIRERERRNLEAMFSHPADAGLLAALTNCTSSEGPRLPVDCFIRFNVCARKIEDWPDRGVFRDIVDVIDKETGRFATVHQVGSVSGDAEVKTSVEVLRHRLGVEGEAFFAAMVELGNEWARRQRAERHIAAAERAALHDGPTCRICGQPKPGLAWLKGWSDNLCPTHRNAPRWEIDEATLVRMKMAVEAAQQR